MSTIRRLLPWLIAVALIVGGVVAMRGRAPKVQVVSPKLLELAEVIALSGRVRGVQESRLAPEINGTIRSLAVSEGEVVTKGQLLAELDPGRLQAQLEQALEKVTVAQAQVKVAERGPLPSQIEEVRAQTAAQKLAARAALESARQKLLEAERGPRSEQIAQAKAGLRESQAEAEQKTREAKRLRALYADGAISLQQQEQAQTVADRAKDNVRANQAKLDELNNGTRPEQLEQARQAVAASQADLQSAQQAGDAKLQQLLDLPRPEDIALAKAQLAEVRSAAQTAKEQLQLTKVFAPYDGVVGRRLLRVGDQASPSQPIFTFSSRPNLEVRVDVDESDRSRLALGQTAKIRATGYPDDFEAELRELSPEVDPVRGTLEARLAPRSAPKWLVPGQTVDVNLILNEQAPRLVLPLTCVIQRGDKREVFVVENDTLKKRSIDISSPTQEGYLVRSGVSETDLVALYPQGLTEGQTVRPQKP